MRNKDIFKTQNNSSNMVIEEFLPNPPGKDKDGEYITLLNDGKETVSLEGWVLKDQSGKHFSLNGYALNSNERKKFFLPETKLSLNNSGETIYLFNTSGELIDELGYSGSAAEGRVIREDFAMTSEIQEKILENFPQISTQKTFFLDAIVFMILSGILLSSISVYILRKYTNEKTPSLEDIF